ncbi:GTD-binding domain-containing protein [Psidium guajava]|nr:GTD-binding domain-containing protein [Psidium guajava]
MDSLSSSILPRSHQEKSCASHNLAPSPPSLKLLRLEYRWGISFLVATKVAIIIISQFTVEIDE